MIAVPPGVRVYLALGRTDMRKGMPGLAMLVQEAQKKDPFSGHLFVFRGRRGDMVKILAWDGQGFCLFTKRLEKGRFVWPAHSTDCAQSFQPKARIDSTCAENEGVGMAVWSWKDVKPEKGRRKEAPAVPPDPPTAGGVKPPGPASDPPVPDDVPELPMAWRDLPPGLQVHLVGVMWAYLPPGLRREMAAAQDLVGIWRYGFEPPWEYRAAKRKGG